MNIVKDIIDKTPEGKTLLEFSSSASTLSTEELHNILYEDEVLISLYTDSIGFVKRSSNNERKTLARICAVYHYGRIWYEMYGKDYRKPTKEELDTLFELILAYRM